MNDLLSRLVGCRKARGNMEGEEGRELNSFWISSAFILPISVCLCVCMYVCNPVALSVIYYENTIINNIFRQLVICLKHFCITSGYKVKRLLVSFYCLISLLLFSCFFFCPPSPLSSPLPHKTLNPRSSPHFLFSGCEALHEDRM